MNFSYNTGPCSCNGNCSACKSPANKYPSLDDIGVKHGTDKSSIHHNYLVFYERFLEKFRFETIKILEIGVFEGRSLRMWEEYFQFGRIVGADINPDFQKHKSDRISVELLDQSKDSDLMSIGHAHGNFDLIIDDGSHIWEHQIKTLKYLFPIVRSGGIYILEDIDTSYGKYISQYKGSSNISSAEYIKLLLDCFIGSTAIDQTTIKDDFIKETVKSIRSINFYPRTVLIEKA